MQDSTGLVRAATRRGLTCRADSPLETAAWEQQRAVALAGHQMVTQARREAKA